jgi:hypothetical protein
MNHTEVEYVAMGCKPDPEKYKVEHAEWVGGNTIVMANYGGETFGGKKLMVLRGKICAENRKTLDPHFLNENHVVVARFQPTDEGMKLARIVALVVEKTPTLNFCAAGLDGECYHDSCPQIADGEPEKTGRFCPLPPKCITALRENA